MLKIDKVRSCSAQAASWPPPNLETSPSEESQRLFCLQLTHSTHSRLCLPHCYSPPICHCDTALAPRLRRLWLYLMND